MKQTILRIEYMVLRKEHIKRALMRIQIEQDGKTDLTPDNDLDLSKVDWRKFDSLWTSYVPNYRQ